MHNHFLPSIMRFVDNCANLSRLWGWARRPRLVAWAFAA